MTGSYSPSNAEEWTTVSSSWSKAELLDNSTPRITRERRKPRSLESDLVHNNGKIHTIRGRRHLQDTSVRGEEKRRHRAATPSSSHCPRMGKRECRREPTFDGTQGNRTTFDAPVNLPRST